MKLTTKLLKKMIVEEINKLPEAMNPDKFMDADHGEMMHQGVEDTLGRKPDPLQPEIVDRKALVASLVKKYGLSPEQADDIISTIQSTTDVRDHGSHVEYI